MDSAGIIQVSDIQNNRVTKGTPALRLGSSPGSLMVSNGLFLMRLTWPFAPNVVIEAAPDLRGWAPIQPNAFTPDCLDVSVPLDPNQYQFFRAHLTPQLDCSGEAAQSGK